MKIAILGSGGREHAIAMQIAKSHNLDELYCIPGNGGTNSINEVAKVYNVNLDINNFEILGKFIDEYKINLVIVGPEKPLVEGVVDFLSKKKIKIFGPNKNVSQLEGSKIFTKKICEKYNIPTSKFGIFASNEDACRYLENANMPIVVKADGLAAGKGVYICEDIKSAKSAVDEIFNGKFGKANQILIEEFLEGDEMSYFVISDGKTFKRFNTAQDHKRVGEKDKGKNTGGMGAYSPSGLINEDLDSRILERIVKPTFAAIKDMGETYKGFLYVGLMIKDNNPYLIEYNVRMGDPETEVVFPRLKNDLLELFYSMGTSEFKDIKLNISDNHAATVILVSGGYPESYEKGKTIEGLNDLSEVSVFHAGTKKKRDSFITSGGRVLAITSMGHNFEVALKNSYNQIDKIKFDGMNYRKDIGFDLL